MKKFDEMEYKYPDTAYVASMFCGCGLTPPRTDCKFYSETRDMCATIPCCSLQKDIGYCPCEKCDKYQSKYVLEKHKTADEMFQDCGYRRYKDGQEEKEITYFDTRGVFIFVDIEDNEIGKRDFMGTKSDLSFAEILACAELIKEMEG